MNRIQISYEIFCEVADQLFEKVRNSGRIYSAILCPLRGGFFLSYVMSRKLNLPMVYIEISSYKEMEASDFQIGIRSHLTDGMFLLCDDIYDSGRTVRMIRELYPGVHFDVASIVSKVPNADILYGMLVDKQTWVDFFWELI